jgi:hypothetical protein
MMCVTAGADTDLVTKPDKAWRGQTPVLDVGEVKPGCLGSQAHPVEASAETLAPAGSH